MEVKKFDDTLCRYSRKSQQTISKPPKPCLVTALSQPITDKCYSLNL